ncbi:5-carboxymethyl-2-hydroxymuconate Delta-isomerase [Streptomyces griseoviridis]|jgi:5-carboxymethyl-2-hydroxymuconate isomerase|uniref:5-carboxymethyl-2-hydroxymuconate isomerase n=2 Tax=Streptomyces griseoviridis TaxID=45398 RepID=A0ABT9LDQ7_STRGD|nr:MULTISPECIES: 5-carboxymethyl-2-hydroxymuconate Delta-isomerase [Streptomyces]MDP9681395.1 5-carboxymethyl-2-hydroxymuconate isomerase [Streptomyces griseoviridis]GGS21259.1 isomerase [Streptomyces niveoruber]GGS74900.1 isomerase [Streptomyces griseoviridis]
MPQITVDHSEQLTDDFDRPGFAKALHDTVVEIAAARPPACKTQFRRTEASTVGPDTEGHAVVHVTIGLLPGRTEETKARLTEAVLDLLRTHITTGLALHASAEVRDLDASYRKFES